LTTADTHSTQARTSFWRRTIELSELVSYLADALRAVDATNPVGVARRFKPGVGPLTEDEVTAAIFAEPRNRGNPSFANCGPRRYPASRNSCDIVLPGQWALEIKLARPFGDNGKPAERWSENLLYPYPGNTSSIGDCLKLIASGFTERKAVIVLGFEHTPPRIALEPAIASFEIIARDVIGIDLGARVERLVTGLVHPYHQQARVYGWEVFGLRP
jgi:hypothetical protein